MGSSIANSYRHLKKPTKKQYDAIYKLVSLSKSFLLAEWFQDILSKTIANDDRKIFKCISKAITADISVERLDTTKKWIAVVMLWYLGGNEIHPRRKLMEMLQNKAILAKEMDPISFNSMLSNIGLTKDLGKSK